MKVIRDKDGRVAHLVLFESELCEKLNVVAGELRQWKEIFPPSGTAVHPDRERPEPIYKLTVAELDRFEKYAKILRTGMSVQQLLELERQDKKAAKAGKNVNFLEMYALLADECPPGVTAHILRSYCVLFLYQNRARKMLLSGDLAKVAGISKEMAERHISILMSTAAPVGDKPGPLLKFAQNPTRWEFAFVPKALSRYYPS